MKRPEQSNLAVEVVRLDAARTARQALPRRAASPLALDRPQLHRRLRTPLVHLALGRKIDIGRLEYGDALCAHGAHKRSRGCLQPAQRLDRVRQVLEQLAVFHTHYPVVDPRLQPGS